MVTLASTLSISDLSFSFEMDFAILIKVSKTRLEPNLGFDFNSEI